MADQFMTEAAAQAAFSSDPRPARADVSAVCEWLGRRYIQNDRDGALTDALAEIVHLDGGRLTPVPLRHGLTRETRGLLVTAPSGFGKSTLIQRNLARLRGTLGPKGLPSGVLAVTAGEEATIKSLAHELCEATGYTGARRTTTKWELLKTVRHRFGISGVGVLWIDEVHHLFVPRRGGDAPADVLRMLKSFLQQEPRVAVIASGICALDGMLRKERETDRRYTRLRVEPVVGTEGRAFVARSVEAYCRQAELAPVADPFLVDRLLLAAKGGFGGCMEMTVAAIRLALLGGRTALTIEDFARVFDRQAEPEALNPFLVRDWEIFARVHPNAGGTA